MSGCLLMSFGVNCIDILMMCLSLDLHRNMGPLSESHRVWAIDLLGQGRSWPTRDPEPEHGLSLSADLWSEQIIAFINEVIREPVYLAGNTLPSCLSLIVSLLSFPRLPI